MAPHLTRIPVLFKLCHLLTFRVRRKRTRKKCWEYFILLNLICACLVYAICINTSMNGNSVSLFELKRSDNFFGNDKNSKSNLSSSRILLWTGMFGKYELSSFEINQETFANCPVSCEVTFDKKLLSASDAVIFHIRDVSKVGMPLYHPPKQVWIFYLQESPENTCLDLRWYKNVFNWTMTHRMDSDIYHPYSRILHVNSDRQFGRNPRKLAKKPQMSLTSPNSKLPRNFSSLYSHSSKFSLTWKKQLLNKPKIIAWVVSNCYTHSNRESFVLEIQKFIQVDIFGKCGNLNCSAEESRECYYILAKTYKFYFAFENSLCVDYITEKFFDSLQFDMVPVVYGDGNYSLIAPLNSYIDVRQFKSAKELAKYLMYLDNNPEAYLKYFEWKGKFKIVPSDGWCSLCMKLNSRFEVKSYDDISKWWHSRPNLNIELETEERIPACLPYPNYPSESWFTKFRKRYFILQ